jgi:hypothetical protein
VGLERGPLSLVITIEELLERKSSGSGLEIREYGRRDPSLWPRGTLYPQKLALTSPTSGCRSVGIVHSRTQARVFSFFKIDSKLILNWKRPEGVISLADESENNRNAILKATPVYLRQITKERVGALACEIASHDSLPCKPSHDLLRSNTNKNSNNCLLRNHFLTCIYYASHITTGFGSHELSSGEYQYKILKHMIHF